MKIVQRNPLFLIQTLHCQYEATPELTIKFLVQLNMDKLIANKDVVELFEIEGATFNEKLYTYSYKSEEWANFKQSYETLYGRTIESYIENLDLFSLLQNEILRLKETVDYYEKSC